ncbi:hypothetical protein VNO77_19320 [Canavalia gladiata]|uniref:Uncharacterized protein n=1 Tax=Canavalia gladiata TaxID=3824 RepID=A0AAN9LQR0_CANGL
MKLHILVSIKRPMARLGYAGLGDYTNEGLEPLALGVIFKNDSPDISSKPLQFTKVSYIVEKGIEEIFFSILNINISASNLQSFVKSILSWRQWLEFEQKTSMQCGGLATPLESLGVIRLLVEDGCCLLNDMLKSIFLRRKPPLTDCSLALANWELVLTVGDAGQESLFPFPIMMIQQWQIH